MDDKSSEPKPVPDVDGHYKLDIRNGSVFITIAGPQGHGERVKIQTVVDDLRNREIMEFDKELLKKAVAEHTGQEIQIGIYKPRDAQIQVVVPADCMQAVIKVMPPAPGAGHISKDALKKALAEKGIIFGIKESVLDEIVARHRYEENILIAEGIPVKDGQDAVFEYKIELEKEKPKFKMDETTGGIDLKEMNMIENVVEGQLLAVKIPAKPGNPGITVENKHVSPKPGKDIPLPAGRGTRISENKLELYAAVNGMILIAANKINVEQIYNVKGNVSTGTGNINFIGSVVIHGAVEDGFKVKAEGNIEVKQTVGKAELEADGDISVGQGIVGHNEAKIKAGGNVRARYIQEANIKANGDVIVSEAIMHSRVEAGERVILNGKKAMIVGGSIIAYREINARTIGSDMSTKTSLEVGIRPALREEIAMIEDELGKDKKNLEQVEQGLTMLLKMKKLKQQLPPDKEKMLLQLAGVREGLKKKLVERMARYDELQEILKTKVPAKICVSGDIHSGVKIGIRNLSLFTTKQYTYTTFFDEDGEIKTRTYDEPRLDKKESQ